MNWHERFRQQAAWTRPLRAHLFTRAGMADARQVLEVGCGTGAVLEDLVTPAVLHGLDIDPARLVEAKVHAPSARLLLGDAHSLPYATASLDITFCHFLLLWVKDPLLVLQEMRRVTRPGGAVLALAEPDHTARLDEPPELQPLGAWQAEALRRQGADPSLGSRLAPLFQQAGIRLVERGQMQQASTSQSTPVERALEWSVLESDLQGMLPATELAYYRQLDEAAWQAGTRRLHVPTYFAFGVV